MEKYLNQLHQDLEAIILEQWQTAQPHFYGIDQVTPYLKAPKGWSPGDAPKAADDPDQGIKSMIEMEAWLDGKKDGAMVDHFGLFPQQFPPPERLTEEQAEALIFRIFRLWSAYNFLVNRPEKAPAKILYKMVVERMLEPAVFMKHGASGIEFCSYDSDDCPFGKEYCDCDGPILEGVKND